MNLYENSLYLQDVNIIISAFKDWDKIKNKSFLISGATGMIGSFLIDVLLQNQNFSGMVYAIGRNREKAEKRFSVYKSDDRFIFIQADINKAIEWNALPINYIFHLASNTHPRAYATDPIGTVTANVIGTMNLLNIAAEYKSERFIFASSVEIYGENRGDTDRFREDYCGYIDCNTMRAGYPESKRCAEALCQAYRRQRKLDVVIPRLSRTFGPTMLADDSKAISQFIRKAAEGENIVLKSEGTQFYSYSYVADIVLGLLLCLTRGKNGEAYNIANPEYDISLKDMARMIASINGSHIVFDLPDDVEKAGYSRATRATLDSTKIQKLGWTPMFDFKTAIEHTISIRKMEKNGQ